MNSFDGCSQALLNKPQPFFALVLSPTRELAVQIASQVRCRCCVRMGCTCDRLRRCLVVAAATVRGTRCLHWRAHGDTRRRSGHHGAGHRISKKAACLGGHARARQGPPDKHKGVGAFSRLWRCLPCSPFHLAPWRRRASRFGSCSIWCWMRRTASCPWILRRSWIKF